VTRSSLTSTIILRDMVIFILFLWFLKSCLLANILHHKEAGSLICVMIKYFCFKNNIDKLSIILKI
jgi:hypothetical protein